MFLVKAAISTHSHDVESGAPGGRRHWHLGTLPLPGYPVPRFQGVLASRLEDKYWLRSSPSSFSVSDLHRSPDQVGHSSGRFHGRAPSMACDHPAAAIQMCRLLGAPLQNTGPGTQPHTQGPKPAQLLIPTSWGGRCCVG